MITDLDKFLVHPDTSIIDAMRAIDRGAIQVALVIDDDHRLLATLTDGDVRRGILRGVPLDAPVSHVMGSAPTFVKQQDGSGEALRLMRELTLHHIAVVDDVGCLVGIEYVNDLVGLEQLETWIVLMAGGLGTRLGSLTAKTPKPMINVGGKPLLESIIQNFSSQGFRNFYLSVNHCKEVLQDHFGDGSKLNVNIDYLVEDTPLGTAGALSLLPERPERPILVMNGDVLTSMKFDNLLRFHEDAGCEATMCGREFSTTVPYGVVKTDGSRLLGIEEKPTQNFLVSAGIYVLSPSTLDLIKPNTRLDMPALFSKLMVAGRTPMVFPVSEYWMDVGRINDLEQARSEYQEIFGA